VGWMIARKKQHLRELRIGKSELRGGRWQCLCAAHQWSPRGVHGFEIVTESRDVPDIGAAQARPQVEQRYVVVARNRQHRRAQTDHESAGCLELRRPCALRDVARQHEKIGPLLPGQRGQRFDDRRLLGSEVRVRDLEQDAHPTGPSGSTAVSIAVS